jgi:tRNA threonylcarbamoyladenosine modification (KEOPS) complex  Pcc1 subunit
MKAFAKIVLLFPTKKRWDTVLKALRPEVVKPVTLRSHVSLARENGRLALTVEAKDTVALRATLNAYLRWINSLVNVLDVLERRF